MAQLLTDKDQPLREAQPHDNLSVVARARTITALTRLDQRRKVNVLMFLYESGLIAKDRPVLDLREADLSRISLFRDTLSKANLSGANLSGAFPWESNLTEADLSGANLSKANLGEANLIKAELYGTYPVRGVGPLYFAKLYEADLKRANLTEVAVTQKQLEDCNSLEGAAMPNGQKYETWLKDLKGREGDGKSSDPS